MRTLRARPDLDWRITLIHVDSFLSGRELERVVGIGNCLTCFGVPPGSVYLVDRARAPQLGDFALVETRSENRVIPGLRRQIKRLGRGFLKKQNGEVLDCVVCESVAPPYAVDETVRLLGTVVALEIPKNPQLSELDRKFDAYIDELIADHNARNPGYNWIRRPPNYASGGVL